jgi:hypothetical protein
MTSAYSRVKDASQDEHYTKMVAETTNLKGDYMTVPSSGGSKVDQEPLPHYINIRPFSGQGNY